MGRKYFLVKSEPDKYSFAKLLRDKKTLWDGVRNFEARNNLRAMKQGDLLLFYHSNIGKEVVGVARVMGPAIADATAPGEDWSVVPVEPVCPMKNPVSLDAIRNEPGLSEIALLKRNRLSVVPVTPAEFALILKMGKTALPRVGKDSADHAAASSR